MQQRAISYQQKIEVQAPPIALDDGRFEARGAVLRILLAVGLFATAAVSALAIIWIWPDYGWPGAVQSVGILLCGATGGVALWFAVAAVRFQMRAWEDYQGFLEDMRTAYHKAYSAARGQQVTQTVRAEEINVKDIRDMLTMVCYVYLTGNTTLSGMRGPLMVNDGKRWVRVGALSDYGAEQAGRTLEELGVLLNAGQGRARQLRQGSLEELVMATVRGWQHSEE